MDIFHFARSSRSGNTWFRILHCQGGAEVFWFVVVILLVVVLLLTPIIVFVFLSEAVDEVFVGE